MAYIDHTVFPDQPELAEMLGSRQAKADYVHRVCSAWDFHILPEPATFALFSRWQDVFDAFPLPASPAYHAFRTWFGWQGVPTPVGFSFRVPLYVALDRAEGRGDDPCECWI